MTASCFKKLILVSPEVIHGFNAGARQNQQNDMCAQQRLRSACASAQSDQSFCYPYEEASDHWPPIERLAKTDQTWRMPRLLRVFAGRMSNCVFSFVQRLKSLS